MNRIFHVRIRWYNYFYLFIVGITAVALLWYKQIIPATVLLLLVVVLIERIIHTTYTITTEKNLVLYFGRFSKKKVIPIKEIQEIEKIKTFKIGDFHLTSYLLLQYSGGKIGLAPLKERDFVMALLKVNPYIRM